MKKRKEYELMEFHFSAMPTEQTHIHQSIELIYVLEGEVLVTVGEEQFRAATEDVLIINSNKRHSYRGSEDSLAAFFQIDHAKLSEILGNSRILFWCNSVVNRNSAYDDLRRIMIEIFNYYTNRQGARQLYLNSMYYQLLQVLVENFRVHDEDRRFRQEYSAEEDRLVEIVSYIQVNYKKRLTLNEMAESLYVSAPYLSKYIKRHLGMNFLDYLNNIRLFHAVDDLLGSDDSVMNIALENGFANANAFNELFKKTYNMTPSGYRRQMREKQQEKEQIAGGPEEESLLCRVDEYLGRAGTGNVLPQGSDRQQIKGDVRKKRAYHRHWKQMVNLGRASDILRADMQEQIRVLKADLGFTYARFWDIFAPEMLMHENSSEGSPNFELLDRILDFLVEHDIIPYIEMGYKPKQIYRTLKDAIIEEHRDVPFRDVKEMRRFYTRFAQHLVNRYGIEEVEKWCFEQWKGERFEAGPYEQYEEDQQFFQMFKALHDAFKAVSPHIMIGGGGIGIQYGNRNLLRLLEQWGRQKAKPDFVSLYCYPYIRGDEDGTAYARISTDRYFLKNQLEMAKEAIEQSELKEAKIHVSEWSFTLSNRNCLNDSCYKGAYVMKSILDSINMVDVLGYWVSSDIFAEHYDNSSVLFGGCGLLSKNGIKKPSYYTYYFLRYMHKFFVCRSENTIVTTDGRNNYFIACHNYRHLNYKYYLRAEDEQEVGKLNHLYEDQNPLCLEFEIAHTIRGKYKIKSYAINSEDGSVQEEWLRMGMAENLTKHEIEYLKRICTPRIQIREAQNDEAMLRFEVSIKPQEILYIHISYLYE